ncbi:MULTISPECIES: acyltransferase [Microbacterium]|uniref:acyltransferase family protein n=1 Tax=Microbacterium TaxID=33882 RepID=UPI00278581FC|nr:MULTISPECIES: acyltransferase [Microbacterium]MDQ1076919.1 peptidoglycan/LPS O-acetylase OafA/YrhL [Microbacterium sp. SORGH_AS_0969]MDQ1117156.1 peptidoglycan/LPS O-acetylase OafA/YrhL [Microbacterium testaceum]
MVPDLRVRRRSTLGARFDPRANSLNAIRLGLALLVLVAHAWELGGYGLETQFLGPLAVAGFFAISGFLITMSRSRTTKLSDFLRRRIARIFPAFLVVLVVTAFLFAPFASLLLGGGTWTPGAALGYVMRNAALWPVQPTIPGMLETLPFPGVWNGSLWTLSYEFGCYIVTGVVGCLVTRRSTRATAALWVVSATISLTTSADLLSLPHVVVTLCTLLCAYMSGALLFLWRDRIPHAPWLIALAFATIVIGVALRIAPGILGPAIAYVLIALGAALPLRIGSRNDISYGVYIYAFPVQQMLALLLSGTGTPVAGYLALSIIFTLPLAWASWLAVERPAMRLGTGPRRRSRRERLTV